MDSSLKIRVIYKILKRCGLDDVFSKSYNFPDYVLRTFLGTFATLLVHIVN